MRTFFVETGGKGIDFSLPSCLNAPIVSKTAVHHIQVSAARYVAPLD